MNINQRIKEFNNIINTLEVNIENSIKQSKLLLEIYNQCIQFVNIMNIIEIYKWHPLRKQYHDLRISIIRIQSIYTDIVNKYTILGKYINNKTELIINIKTKINIMTMFFEELRQKHIILSIHSKKCYKINIESPLIDKLYILYDKMKDIRKKINELKKEKLQLYTGNTLAEGSI